MLAALRNRWQELNRRETPGPIARFSPPAWLARAPQIVTITLGIAITLQVVDIAVTLYGELATASAAGPSVMREHSGRRASAGKALDTLMAAHLFGEAPRAATAGSARASRAPLMLTGIIATGDPGDGYAILGTSAARTRAVHAGSQAAPGTILAEVYPQRVVLLRGTERLTLTLPKASASAELAYAQPGIRGVFRSDGAPEVASGEGGIAQRPSPEDFKPPPRSDASTIMSAFSMRPVSIDGQRGVRIMGTGINSATLAALGLAPGDVILQINGGTVGSKGTPNLAEALKSGTATLVVDRDGGATSVTIDANAAATAADAYRQATRN